MPAAARACYSQRQIGAALGAHRQIRLLQVELALEPAARLVGEASLAQKLVQELPFGLDQLQPQFYLLFGALAVVRGRQLLQPAVIACPQLLQDVLGEIALLGEFLQALARTVECILARNVLGVRLSRALLDPAVRQAERTHHDRQEQAKADQGGDDDAERDEQNEVAVGKWLTIGQRERDRQCGSERDDAAHARIGERERPFPGRRRI